jgi:hypothetical protein
MPDICHFQQKHFTVQHNTPNNPITKGIGQAAQGE